MTWPFQKITQRSPKQAIPSISSNRRRSHRYSPVSGLLQSPQLECSVNYSIETREEFALAFVRELLRSLFLRDFVVAKDRDSKERPKMSEVVRMLVGDGLAEKWEEWQKVEVIHQELDLALPRNSGWIVDSTYNIHAACPK